MTTRIEQIPGQAKLSPPANTLLQRALAEITNPIYRVEERDGALWIYLVGHRQPLKRPLSRGEASPATGFHAEPVRASPRVSSGASPRVSSGASERVSVGETASGDASPLPQPRPQPARKPAPKKRPVRPAQTPEQAGPRETPKPAEQPPAPPEKAAGN